MNHTASMDRNTEYGKDVSSSQINPHIQCICNKNPSKVFSAT